MKNNERKHRFGLTLTIAAIIFIIILAAVIVAFGIVYVLIAAGVFSDVSQGFTNTTGVALLMAGVSLVMGMICSFVFTRLPINPINKTIDHMDTLASGDFSVRLSFPKPLSKFSSAKEFCNSFNKMAEELGSTEVLRSDFINNFSHEFKTPIVSIAGFAKLLKRGNLTEEQKAEYLDIIEKESMRLSAMATNVLSITKVENQTILTEVSSINVSEQVRSSILLLEEKWSKKNIEFDIEFSEHELDGNEEMLKQVWINLLDNAIKFSYEGEEITVEIKENRYSVVVAVTNRGECICEEKQKHIFNKFYQADESHSGEGNGIGLALVKCIVELHKGGVFVHSADNKTTFTVVLPKRQHNYT